MKKVIIGVSAVLISAFVIILAVNAQDKSQETKKSCTEMAKDGAKCPAAASSCCKMKYGNTTDAKAGDLAKCKEKCGDQAKCEGKCSHGSCKNESASAAGEGRKCCETAPKTGSTN